MALRGGSDVPNPGQIRRADSGFAAEVDSSLVVAVRYRRPDLRVLESTWLDWAARIRTKLGYSG
jgi:hypothetical protein